MALTVDQSWLLNLVDFILMRIECVVLFHCCCVKKKFHHCVHFHGEARLIFRFFSLSHSLFFRNIFQKPFELAFLPYFLGTEGGRNNNNNKKAA